MDNQLQAFLRGINEAACSWFDTYGGGLEALGTAIVIADNPLSTTVGPGLILANAAAQGGCNFDPDEPAPGGPSDTGVNGCSKVSAAGANINAYKADGTLAVALEINSSAVEITGTNYDASTGLFTYTTVSATGVVGGGSFAWTVSSQGPVYIRFDAVSPITCVEERDDEVGEDFTPEDIPDYEYSDTETGCTFNITFKGYVEGPGGDLFQVTQIAPSSSGGFRGSGGIIGGCNFNPTIVVNQIGGGGGCCGGGGEPPITIPVPDPVPDPDDDWWKAFVAAALAEVLGSYLEILLNDFLAPIMPSSIYRMVSVCERDSSGEPISEAVEVPIPALKAPDAQVARLDAIVELLQAAKNFKQPVCSAKPELLGDWVTVRFESLEISPQGTRPLRKLFRYRSQSAYDLGQIAAYWENFQWDAGPVCVQHKNAWWGTPQCWAVNAEEGKRVIRFAGLEAGIDPDVLGEWVISGSTDPRFGMPGTMRVAKVQGLEWVTSRQGPSGLPLLTVDP